MRSVWVSLDVRKKNRRVSGRDSILSARGEIIHQVCYQVLKKIAMVEVLGVLVRHIRAGAVLGRMKVWQYTIVAVLFIPAYMLNEWIVLDKEYIETLALRRHISFRGSTVFA